MSGRALLTEAAGDPGKDASAASAQSRAWPRSHASSDRQHSSVAGRARASAGLCVKPCTLPLVFSLVQGRACLDHDIIK